MLVDPGKLTMNFDPPPSPQGGGAEDCHAEGVITVTLTARSPAQEKGGMYIQPMDALRMSHGVPVGLPMLVCAKWPVSVANVELWN